jgi:hypothetical protein
VSGTTAVPSDVLAAANPDAPWAGRPLCPACKFGHLHPFEVQIGLCREPSGWHGVRYLTGWVAVCVGDAEHRRTEAEEARRRNQFVEDLDVQEPCGFAMPLTPHSYPS